jgi:lysophospholipase L1-like esterase
VVWVKMFTNLGAPFNNLHSDNKNYSWAYSPLILYLCFLLIPALWSQASADELMACSSFTDVPLAEPSPQTKPEATERLAAINDAVQKDSEFIFFGDSLIQRWPTHMWDQDFASRGGINGGIDGDRTDNLVWRLAHGNLAGPPSRLIVLLIGTNDLGHSWSPVQAAQGIRRILMYLRDAVPKTNVLLLGLLPRTDRFGSEIAAVNDLIKTCSSPMITYLDAGQNLLDGGKPSREMTPDGVHLSETAYNRLTQVLVPEITALARSRQ